MDTRHAEPFDTADILAQAILDRLHDRRWYRSQPRRSHWADLAHDNDIALRALVGVARQARRLTAAAPPLDEPDEPVWLTGDCIPVALKLEGTGWSEAELRWAAGDR